MIAPPTAFFSTHRKLIGDWSAIPGDTRSLVAETGLTLSQDYLSKLPNDCSLSGNRSSLDAFPGYKLISIWPSHFLHDDAERGLAFDAIERIAGYVVHAFVVDRRRLSSCESELEKTGSIYGYAGWKFDPETKYAGYFLEIRIDCRPRVEKVKCFARCWQESLSLLGLDGQFDVTRNDDSWMLLPKGALKFRTTIGEPSGRNTQGAVFFGFSDLADVQRRLGRLAEVGPLERQMISCRVLGRDYLKVQSELNKLGPGWEVIISCDLLPENVALIKAGEEPHVSEIPGASLSWQNGRLEADASLGFKRIDGQWHAVVGAFCNTLEAERELTEVLAAQGYERSV